MEVRFDILSLILKGKRLKFELSTDNAGVRYEKRGVNAKVEVGFYKLRVKEQMVEEKIAIVNDFKVLKIKEDTFLSNKDRRILTMRMSQGLKTEIDIIFEEVELLGNKDKLTELAGFFDMGRDSPGIKPNTVSAGSIITVEFPKIHIYL